MRTHVGTHGSCVRSNNHVYTLSFPLSGRTSRASLQLIWAILMHKMAEIETQDGRNRNAHALKSKREFSQKAIKKVAISMETAT